MADDGDVIKFDEATFDNLIRFMTDCKDQLDTEFLRPRSGCMLDSSLGTYLRPGSSEWPVVTTITEGGSGFGGSVRQRLEALSTEWEEFITALRDAKTVFKDSDDLATMSAREFLEQHPELAPPNTPSPDGVI
ncbi:hypothetical protein ACN27F_02820 [Solwaraspora sp. WMMB335]|uniref:hypothetical protein n=1 Tax=Solwaraspora sp. WMMB335 TaxID=3404118 RepID=UPI003B93E339